MKCAGGGCSQRDLVGGGWAILLWCFPTGLIVLGALTPSARAALWIPCFAIMGVACLVNARGCGRLHCFLTGPLFLMASCATALDTFDVKSIDWKIIFIVVGVGTLLAYGLEWLRGKYVGAPVP